MPRLRAVDALDGPVDAPLPWTRTIVTGLSVMSPLRSKPNDPSSPSLTRVRKSSCTTDALVPSDRAIASSSTSVAWAA